MKPFKPGLLLLYTVFVNVASLTTFAQIPDKSDSLSATKNIFDDFHWYRESFKTIDNKKGWTYFANGKEYLIQIKFYSTNDAIVSTKSLIKMLASGHKKQNQQINVPWLPVPNRIFSMWSKLDTLPIFTVRYIAPATDDKIYDISVLAYDTRDSILEEKFVQSVIKNSISDSLFLSPGPGMINFAGRTVQLKNNFEWMAPDNIYCPGKGQMNWSVHASMNKAIRARDFQLLQNGDLKLVEILKKDTVPVSFEGSNVQALRITYKSKVPRIFWGKGSKVLHVYYIVASVRNQFVNCVLSHYEDQQVNGVPPPLDSVMMLLI